MKKLNIILIAIGLLAGCHHDNPLLIDDEKTVGRFLYDAQLYATKQTQFYNGSQDTYLACVDHPARFDNPFNPRAENICPRFFKEMLIYAHQTEKFKTLALSDLKDKTVTQKRGRMIFDYLTTDGHPTVRADHP